MDYFVVKYSGAFGYIKPWSAVRDIETYSQQFLTPSIVEGIEKNLFPELLSKPGIHKIKRHKLSCRGISVQQEVTQARDWKQSKSKKRLSLTRKLSILKRGVMLSPELYLAFDSEDDAKIAVSQHVCLCRNEDILLPEKSILKMNEDEFRALQGFELRFEIEMNSDGIKYADSFMVGFNRFDNGAPMYGHLEINGESVLS